MRNLIAIFAKFLEICKDFSSNLVNESGNVPRRGVVPKFSDLEVIALSMTAEHFSIDSENLLFHILHKYKSSIPNLISRRQYNDRRKQTRNLCNEIRQRIAECKHKIRSPIPIEPKGVETSVYSFCKSQKKD